MTGFPCISCCTHGAQRMNHNDVGDSLEQPASKSFNLMDRHFTKTQPLFFTVFEKLSAVVCWLCYLHVSRHGICILRERNKSMSTVALRGTLFLHKRIFDIQLPLTAPGVS